MFKEKIGKKADRPNKPSIFTAKKWLKEHSHKATNVDVITTDDDMVPTILELHGVSAEQYRAAGGRNVK